MVAFRASGTEPLIRCYIEAKSQRNLAKCERLAGRFWVERRIIRRRKKARFVFLDGATNEF